MSKRYTFSPWIFFIFLFGFVIWRLIEYHAFPDPRVLAQAQRQYWSRTPIRGTRGVILDYNGNFLAVSVPASTFFIDSAYWSPSDAPALEGLIPDSVFRRISGAPSGRFISLVRRASPEIADKIRALNLRGVFEKRETRREYPNGSLLAHVLGFCDADEMGQAGIELAWDSTLYKPDGYIIMIRQSGGRTLAIGSDGAHSSRVSAVRLTIDARIQYIVERYLNQAASEHNAQWGAAICIDPNTGAVLAMASWPTFNPNNRAELTSARNVVNNVVGRVYEPGSTFKTIYMGIALEDGLVRKNEIFNSTARINIADGSISEVNQRGMGRISAAEILIRSSNVGMAQIGMRSRAVEMYRNLTSWGFGRVSDIELPGVERGLLASPSLWRGVIPANISIGQGIAVTPLQLAVAMAAVVNGGELLSPFIVQEAVDANGEVVYRGRRNVIRNVLSRETSAWLRTTMRDTVLHGTGRRAGTPVTEVAVKTGTAQVAERGVYVRGRYVGSIIGFWPYSNPQYLMLVVIGEPSGNIIFGGELAAPVFRNIVEGITELEVLGLQRRETL